MRLLLSPIYHGDMTEGQLAALTLVGLVTILAVGAIGLVALGRYRARWRVDRKGPAPWKLVLLVVGLALLIFGAVAWHAASSPARKMPVYSE